MDRPHIALINLEHPLLKEPNKSLRASEVLRNLKADGQAWWARYKGVAERMIWASIPPQAIINTFSLGALVSLSDAHTAVSDLLHLPEFRAGRSTKIVASKLREKNVILDTSSAAAMGSVCKQFGLHDKDVKLHHIASFVACLVDSWTITLDAANVSNSIATAFATGLSSRIHHTQDVAAAFVNGLRHGTETLAFYARHATHRGRTI